MGTETVRPSIGETAIILNKSKFTPLLIIGAILIAAIFCLCLAIVYIWAKPENTKHVESIVSAVTQKRYNSDGTLFSSAQGEQIQFWTPSEKTYKQENINEIPEEYRWQKLSLPGDKLAEFEKFLAKYSTGWRRQEIYGSGRSGNKYGYWWVITVKPGFDENSFAAKYSNFWGNADTVYFELPIVSSTHLGGQANNRL
ncbi:hypothetical protein [uncultured Microbulbifer sp.]|uniref:hypothetical protein n=1 Tax=uncultured Microbulbifer sp. TaxID=348147 RepID=UPI00260AE446|nr:hypothetical protein [uncultured Microbulbifer sp.]